MFSKIFVGKRSGLICNVRRLVGYLDVLTFGLDPSSYGNGKHTDRVKSCGGGLLGNESAFSVFRFCKISR